MIPKKKSDLVFLLFLALTVGIAIVGILYAVLHDPAVVDREDAGLLISVTQNPGDFLKHERFTVVTSTHILTTLCEVSARRGARCEIVATDDGRRWLVLDDRDNHCRVVP